jgi:hypothetical protein
MKVKAAATTSIIANISINIVGRLVGDATVCGGAFGDRGAFGDFGDREANGDFGNYSAETPFNHTCMKRPYSKRDHQVDVILGDRNVRTFTHGFFDILLPMARHKAFIIPDKELLHFMRHPNALPTVRKMIMKIPMRGTLWQVDAAYVRDWKARTRAKL